MKPLNCLKASHPNLYQQHVKKYEYRPQALQRRVHGLDCYWNDVLHFTPIHPGKVLEGLRKCGLEATTLGRWLRFDVRELGFDKTNTVIFWSPNQEFGYWKESKEDFTPYRETELSQLSELPSKTLCFYQERIDKEEVPLLFFRTPHVLFKGTVALKNGVEITII
ncbi:hypothetical protein [Vibrio owensii]|uniref:hypothetical protein n=1 Tax=Vibrio owensii TaxID=696485 RepID=UPI001FCFC640|nr:hypothetical protein [Vibrio owensii]